MKPLVIYHDNCADGFGAAFAAWLKLGDEAEYLPMQYGAQPDETVEIKDRDMYILDFSFPRQVMERLFGLAKKTVWLDHHKTAFEMWCGDEAEHFMAVGLETEEDEQGLIVLNNYKSGALLAWEYFHPDKEIPMLIRHIDDHDRWQFKLEGTKEFNKALWSYAPWSFEQWELFSDFSGPMLRSEGAAILRAHNQNVQAVVNGAARNCTITKYNTVGDVCFSETGLAANCPPHLASDVGHQLANKSGTFGLLWYVNHEGKCLCSLRSNGDYDVSAIAKAFGGGGHKNAAGFEVDIQTLLGWLR